MTKFCTESLLPIYKCTNFPTRLSTQSWLFANWSNEKWLHLISILLFIIFNYIILKLKAMLCVFLLKPFVFIFSEFIPFTQFFFYCLVCPLLIWLYHKILMELGFYLLFVPLIFSSHFFPGLLTSIRVFLPCRNVRF